MPSPHQFDPVWPVPLFFCPDCLKPMRIAVVEIGDDGRERIKLTCEECGTEEIQDLSI